MSFVSKGEKEMHNKAKKGSAKGERSAMPDAFGKKGERKMRNEAPGSKDAVETPVSEDATDKSGYAPKTAQSEYDPASGKRAKSIADLRAAAKKLNERSLAGEYSPTGSQGGQDAKHSSSKNATGYMKAGLSKMDKKSKKPPRGMASQESDLVDPLDDDQVDNDETKIGMTPSGGKKRAGTRGLRKMVDD